MCLLFTFQISTKGNQYLVADRIPFHQEELRQELENEELEEDKKVDLSTELLQLEAHLNSFEDS